MSALAPGAGRPARARIGAGCRREGGRPARRGPAEGGRGVAGAAEPGGAAASGMGRSEFRKLEWSGAGEAGAQLRPRSAHMYRPKYGPRSPRPHLPRLVPSNLPYVPRRGGPRAIDTRPQVPAHPRIHPCQGARPSGVLGGALHVEGLALDPHQAVRVSTGSARASSSGVPRPTPRDRPPAAMMSSPLPALPGTPEAAAPMFLRPSGTGILEPSFCHAATTPGKVCVQKPYGADLDWPDLRALACSVAEAYDGKVGNNHTSVPAA